MISERFNVVYQLAEQDETTAWQQAKTICLEQTVEVDAELVPEGFIHDQVIGRIEQFSPMATGGYEVNISYAIETTAFELTQLFNVIFGNSSLKAKIQVKHLNFNQKLLAHFPGPQLGIAGLRKRVNVYDKPLLCTALKPMGKSVTELAQLAYSFALGGVDIIKDDHGLTNQSFAPYQARAQACIESVANANAKTGRHCIYVPNVTAPMNEILERAHHAKLWGAGGILIAPGLTGFDALRILAQDKTFQLPIISHPAFLGSMVVTPQQGLAHGVLFGQLQRLVGADASIYPNYGGRFGFSKEACKEIAQACQVPFGDYPPIFPAPGGGMTLEKIPEMLAHYGHEVIFLIGGALYSRSTNLVDNARYFLSLVGRN